MSIDTGTASSDAQHLVVTLSCPDRPGIVHAVTGALARRGGEPVLDPDLLRVRPFVAGLAASVLFFGFAAWLLYEGLRDSSSITVVATLSVVVVLVGVSSYYIHRVHRAKLDDDAPHAHPVRTGSGPDLQ